MRYSVRQLFACLVVCLAACSKQPAAPAPPPQVSLNVFAAASLTESFTEIGAKFQSANPGVTVQFNFAGSQQLRSQIESGAKADVFASASEKDMAAARDESLMKSKSIHDFARNHLIVIYPKTNPAKIVVLNDLGNPGVKIDVADVSVPVGKYTRQMLDQMSSDPIFGPDFKRRFLGNIVSQEENVKSIVGKVRLGEVDAGVVYVTDFTPEAAKEIMSLTVPDKFNPVASYPIAVIAKCEQPDLAAKFEDFVISSAGQDILHKYGFISVTASGQ